MMIDEQQMTTEDLTDDEKISAMTLSRKIYCSKCIIEITYILDGWMIFQWIKLIFMYLKNTLIILY
jgi:hypothetical protein